MRYGGVISAVVLVWLLIGVLAAWQRDYFTAGDTSCATAGNVALTVLAGPLNYAGVNPKVTCTLPQPSSMPTVDIERLVGMESS
jgi:Tfp pilus assembly protein PilW